MFMTAGNKLLDTLPPGAQSQAWKAMQASHLALLPRHGRRLGTSFGGVKVLFLHHFGAKSGAERLSPLLYVEDGGNLAIIASKGGHVRIPPGSTTSRRTRRRGRDAARGPQPVHARVAEGEERKRIWTTAAKVWPDYNRYQERAPHREIPVVVLEPR